MTIYSLGDDLKNRFGQSLRIGSDCDLPADLCVEIEHDAVLVLGDRVSIRRGTTIQVRRGATVAVGNDVAIGEKTVISAMIGIRIGDHVGIADLASLYDHHRDCPIADLPDGKPTPRATGFVCAPIIIETGVVIGAEASIEAGVRIGQNSIIEANSTVTCSIGPNTVAAGSPATAIRTFDAVLSGTELRPEVTVAWFGTSIMQHCEGFNAQMVTQSALPAVGSTVVVEAWHNRGYVHRLHTTMQALWPYLDITFHNYGEGGATSRDVLQIVRDSSGGQHPAAVSVLGCGINDVWRGFQGRHTEAVDLAEFATNYRTTVELLTARSRQLLCVGETPFGWDDSIDLAAANTTLQQYNSAAAQIARAAGAVFIDVWPAFTATARQFSSSKGLSLWSDGVHLSEHGDALLHELVHPNLHDVLARMTTYAVHEPHQAAVLYRRLFAAVRQPRHPSIMDAADPSRS